MTAVLLPRPTLAMRHPAVRAVLVLLLAGPATVAWWGKDTDAPLRLRLLGFLLAAVVALSWDDRAHVLTASTPVGIRAVRRGRALVVTTGAVLAFGLGWLAVPGHVAGRAIALQAATVAVVLLVVVGWFGRDGEPVLVLPFPSLLLTLAVLNRLPHQIALLRTDPSAPEWVDERTRWWVLLGLSALVVLRLERDPAARYFWRA